MRDGEGTRGSRLDSWKEIATHLRVSVRTAQRWEAREGLPVVRHHHERLGTVYAFAGDLDAWLSRRADAANAAPGTDGTRRRESPRPAARTWAEELRRARERLAATPAAIGDDPADGRAGVAVGRGPQMRDLAAALEATEGAVRVVCVAGEAGSGKTTLLEIFRHELQTRREPVRVVVGRCSERLAGSEAYLPILEILDQLAGEASSPAAELMRLAAPTWYVQIASLWSSTESALADVALQARAASSARMKREMAAYLQELTAAGPLVILLDDLHWADPSTVELVAHLCTRPELRRVLIVGSYRKAEMALADHPFLRVRRDLESRGLCRELKVPPLSQPDTEEYLSLWWRTPTVGGWRPVSPCCATACPGRSAA